MTNEKARPEHSPLGASQNERWLNCPGSVNLIKKLGATDEPSEHAARGTAAHAIAARCLTIGFQPWELAGETEHADGFDFEVDAEMVDAVQLYLDMVLGDAGKDHLEISVECPVNLKELHPDLWGTLDAAVVSGSLLRVYDFKYGVGVVVEARENTQLMQYAASLLDEISGERPEIDEIELVIVQPRAPHPQGPVRRWRISVDELGEWVSATLEPGAKRTGDPDAPLAFGDWCRFCPAKGSCPEYRGRVRGVLEAVERDGVPDDLSNMEEWELGEQLGLRAEVNRYFATLEEEAFRRMMNKRPVPGFKIVRGVTQRVWRDDAEAEIRKALGDDALTEPKLKTPAQVEKIGKQGKALASEWAFKPEGKLTLAPASDKRDAVDPRDVGEILNAD